MKTKFLSSSIVAIVVGVTLSSQANTYTVTTTNDTGPGSLRAIIITANGANGPHVINFGNTGHFAGGGTIALVSPLPQITQSVTIAGWRSGDTTNNAIALTGSPFVFGAGTSNNLQQLNISGSITNGQSISITGCVITNGGIQSAGVLQITSSSVVSSPSAGIWSSGSATLNRTTISRCSAAGIHNEGAISISESLISNNTCLTDGGGIWSSGSVQLLGCQIIGNVTLNGSGGGVFNVGNAIIAQTEVSGNSAYSGFGGGIYSATALACRQSLISWNLSRGANSTGNGGAGAGVGGGIFQNSGSATLENCTIFGNSCVGGDALGGGVEGRGGTYNTSATAGASGAGPNGGSGGTPGAKWSLNPRHLSGWPGGAGVAGGFGSGGGGGGGGGTGSAWSNGDVWPGGSGGNGANGGFGAGGGGGGMAGLVGTTAQGIAGNGGQWGGSGTAATANAPGVGGGGGGLGAGLFARQGQLHVANCTVASNSNQGGSPNGQAAGALFVFEADLELLNTLVANNTAPQSPDVVGEVISLGYNFVGNNSGSDGWDALTDYQNAVPLLLGPFQDNGGPTFTCALLPGSLCILAGTSVGAPATDQRGIIRPLGKCDIGAYQYTTLIQTVVTWTNPVPIVYSTPLSSVQLNASANAGGSFTYSPPAGTVLNAGSNQVLTAIFTPSDPTSYIGATNTVLITVLKTNQTINFPTIPPQTVNAPPILLNATASSGLPVSYSLISGDALLAANLLSAGSTPGQVVVRASQGGNDNYLAAADVEQSFLVVAGSKPSITSQPTNQTVDLGGSAMFSVAATTAPLTYQWQSQSLDMPGQTNQSLSLLRVKASQSGPYRVIVSNPIGSVTSVVAVLTVNVPPGVPNIPIQPGNPIIRVGETLVLSVGATGNPVLKYQWYGGQSGNTNGIIIGATNPTCSVSGLVNTTNFWVSVSNSLGMLDSATATVTVVPATAARLSLSRISGMAFISVDGPVGTQYLLQYSTNLSTTNWNTLLDYNQNVNPFIYIDSGSLGSRLRFYWAVAH